LIVRECGEVAYKAYWDNPETVRGIHIQEKIKQHFGVEELPVCKHEWYSAKNQYVLNGSVCVKCYAIDPREPEELKNENQV
jgi:hypothetical protein